MKNKACFYQKNSIEIVDGEGTHEFPYHTHESFMIGVIKSGKTKFVIGNNEYILVKGMTYLVPPNVGISITPMKPYSYLTICIKNEMKAPLLRYNSDLYVYYNLGVHVMRLCKDFKSNKLSSEQFVDKLIVTLQLQETNEVLDNSYSPVVKDTIKFISEHYDNKFQLDELARAVHLSKYHLVRIFKNEMGITPKQYDQQCKIRRVKESILNEQNEADVAYNLNFSSQSHLCTMFKRYMGISMNDYKSNMKNDKQ